MARQVELKQIPVSALKKGRYQTRQIFSQDSLNELAESIKSQGIVQPLVVCQLTNNEYEIVAGERRWRAAQQIQLATVPCLVKAYSEEQIAAVTTIENLQRENLNGIEEANAFLSMVNRFDYTHEEVGLIVGKSRTYVTNSLRLLKLDEVVQQLIISQSLSLGHAKVLAGLDKPKQREWAHQCLLQHWSVRQLEKELEKKQKLTLPQNSSIGTQSTVDVVRLESTLAEQVGSEVKVELIENQNSGWFKVKFYDADTLSGLLNRMGLKEDPFD